MLPDNILSSQNLPADLHAFLSTKKYSKVAVLMDENTRRHCYPIIEKGLPAHFCIDVKSGEEQKTLTTCTLIWQALTDHNVDRHAVLIVLGGGVLGDMGGFCAATYKRGIDFILVATTLLAQADASIGGKLAVDFNHFKNHIGVFQLPTLTLLYSQFFKTLPAGELRSGFAEVVKHALISDKIMWDQIRTKSLDEQDWDSLVQHSVNFKAHVVTVDPKEKGLRKILNAGHTIGHAIESFLLGKGNKVLHGEAIAAGLTTESYIAVNRGLLDRKSFGEIVDYLLKVFGKIDLSKYDLEEIAKLTLQDKKNKEDKILCVLPEGIGNAKLDCEISLDEIKGALSFYNAL
jgi:3-dehydroquinate synthase